MSAVKVIAISALAGALLLSETARAQVGNDNATGTAGQFDSMVTTAGSYEPYSANLTRSITDLLVAGGVGSYPLAFTRTMNSRYVAGANVGFGQAGFWSHPYQWSIEDEVIGTNTGSEYPTSFTVNYPDGRSIIFSSQSGSDPYLHGPPGVRDRFQRGTECYLHLPDGGRIWFHMNTYREQGQDGVTTFSFDFKGIIDPYGLVTTITYPSDGSVTITEPAGRTIKLFYGSGTGLLDHITATDGRTVQYRYASYTTASGVSYTVLSRVIYFGDWSQAGSAFYSYQDDNIDPDGPPLIASCYDPMFAGPMKSITYSFATGNNPDGTATVYGQLLSENHYDPSTGNVVAVSTLAVNGDTRTETRGDGPSRVFTYSAGRLSNWTDFRNASSSQSLDSAGFVGTLSDPYGHLTQFSNNSFIGVLNRVQFPSTPNDTPSGTPPGVVRY